MKAGREVAVFRDRLYICIFKSAAGLYFAFSKTSITWRYTRSMAPHKFSSRKGSVRVSGGQDTIWIAFDCFWTARVCLSNARDGIKFLITWSLNQVFKKIWREVFFKVVFFSLKSFVPLNFDSNWLGIIVDREISLNFLNLENLSSSWILEIQFFWMLKVHRIIFICKIFLFDLVFGREHETTAVEMFFRLSTGIN